MKSMATNKLNTMQLAVLEAILLLNEMLATLGNELDGVSDFIESECGIGSEALAKAFGEGIDEPVAFASNALSELTDRIAQFLELPKQVLGDQAVEKLLARTQATYSSEDGEAEVDSFVPASLGTLAWKLADRLKFLTEQSYEPDAAVMKIKDAPYVVELTLE